MPLQAALASTLPEDVVHFEDFSGGQWRHLVYPNASEWPAVCTAFERIKYRYTLQSGKKVIFKFLGLGTVSPNLTSTSEVAAILLQERSVQGLASPVLGVSYGFVAMEWAEGTPASLNLLSPIMLDAIGEYIAFVAGSPMPKDEAREALERLTEMLYVNVHESLGEKAAKRTRRYQDAATYPPYTYGDGHMQPHEWTHDKDNRLFKVDSVGHDCDHTLIGKQSVAWDIAGVIVEWRLDTDAITQLLKAFHTAGGSFIDSETLNFYRAAYLAFRLGQSSLAAQHHDPNERNRLLGAVELYRQQLADLLEIEVSVQPT
jgi:hypothetical protein